MDEHQQRPPIDDDGTRLEDLKRKLFTPAGAHRMLSTIRLYQWRQK